MKYYAQYMGGEKIYEVEDDNVIIDLRGMPTIDPHYYVMPDIQPYRSQINGQIVESRSTHRRILKEHKCIEVGNEIKYLKSKPITTPAGLKQKLIDVVNSKL